MLLGAAIMSIPAYAQKISADKVPAAVVNSFKTQFPKAEKVTWEMEDKTDYEAKFSSGSTEQSATFDAKGTWKETETEIKVSELPQPVQQTLSKQFAGYKILEASKVEDAKHGSGFEVETISEDFLAVLW